MNALELIIRKRDGHEHSVEEIDALVAGVVDESIPDYQLAAWLMAVHFQGMSDGETSALTMAMARSGTTIDLGRLRAPTADKHSTGGVGDKTSLVVGPLAAATELTVAKMSGRGLGHTGGTLDKLESIPGFQVELSIERFLRQAEEIGLVIAGQTGELAPADKRLYALRDVTGTVPSIPLIAASIMSKKFAAGAEAIALDVKVGKGAFMRSEDDALALARTMVALGERAGRKVAAAITRMDQPLGRAVGNALEVEEAVETLRGRGPADLHRLAYEMTGLMHWVAGNVGQPNHAFPDLDWALRSGRALDVLRSMVRAQGGDETVLDGPGRFPRAPLVEPLVAEDGGWVADLDALDVGQAAVELGAGRTEKGQAIDHAVGIRLHAKVGDRVERGSTLAEIHARSAADVGRAGELLRLAYRFEAAPVEPPALIAGHVYDSHAEEEMG